MPQRFGERPMRWRADVALAQILYVLDHVVAEAK
jgi:hypothetical protein